MQNTQKTIGTLSDLHKADIESLPVLALSARAEKIQWVKTVLNQFAYFTLSREDKGLIREYIQHMTGCSRAQTARYIADTQSAAHEVSASAPVRNIQKSHIASAVLTLALLLLISRSTSPMFASVTHTDSSASSVANNPVYVAALSQASSKSSQHSYSSATSVRPADRTAAEQLFVLQTFVADRKASRLARLITHNAASAQSSSVLMARPDRGIETKVFPPYPPLSGTHPAASVSLSLKDVLAMLGSGTDGQILQMQGGRPAWVDFPYLQQIRSLAPQGEEPTRRGGGLRNGGAPQSTTNTTIVNNITTGGTSAPSGWTEGVGVVYLTDATDFVGIGTDTPDTNLEVVGSISGASLYIASSIEGAGLTACDPVNGKIVWDSVTKQFSCGTDNAVGTGLSIQTADQRYVKKQGDTMTGALVINIQNGNLASVGLNVINTISGAVIHAEKSLTTSGTLVFEGAASGSSLYLGKSLNGAGLVDCSTAGTSKLLWNAASGRFSCGTDTDTNTTYTAGQGLGMNGTIITLNANLSGSLLRFTTISGSTVFANTSLRSSGSLTVAGNTILRGTISGSTLHIEKTLSVSGSIVTEGTISGASLFVGTSITGAGLTTCSNATTSKLLWNAATGRFVCGTDTDTNTPAWSSTGALQIQFDNRYVRTSGGTMTGSLTVARSISGATIHAEKSLTTSGTLVFEGAASGSALYLGASLNGAGLVDCSTAGTSKLLWNATTGRFGCGTDQNTGTAYTAGQGIGVNSNVITLNASISGSLIRFTTISGSTIYGKNSINSSGSITAEGTISGANLFVGTSITGAGLTTCNSATSALQWNAVTGRFSCGTIAAGSSTSSGNVITIGDSRYVRKSGDTMTGALTVAVTNGNRNTVGINVVHTISGAVIHAEKSLTTSGTLVFEGAASGSSLYIASSLQGAGLVDCSTAGTSKLLWNAASGRFSCGTDQNSGTTYTAGQGLSLNGTVITLNANISGSLIRFTTISGSTVYAKNSLRSSGSLIVAGTANIRGSFSGSNIHAEKGLTASGNITTEGTISGASLSIGTSIYGAGLSDCVGGNKLLWNGTTGRFSCGVDQAAGTGLDQNSADARYVNTSGDTMTGALVIRVQGGNPNTIGLNVMNTISGAVVHAEKGISTSGSVFAFNNMYANMFMDIDNPNGAYINLSEQGTSVLAEGAIIGRNIHSSGSVVFDTFASGASLYISTSIRGAGLVDCSTSGTSKLLWNATTGRFSCGTDTDTNTTYTAGQGLSLNGTVITLNANISGSLIRFTTISGSTVFAKNTLATSGSLIVSGTANVRGAFSGSNIHAEKGISASGSITTEGTISGANLFIGTGITGAGLTTCSNATTSKLLWNSATGRFSCGTDFGTSVGSGQVIAIGDTRYVRKSGDTMTGALTINIQGGTLASIGLKVLNTFSGAIIHAEKALSSSGTIAAVGNITTKASFSGSSLRTSFGTAVSPALQIGTANTGFFQATDGGLALSVGGTTTFEALPSRFLLASGTSGTPSLSFMNNSDVGLYNVGAKLGFSTNGISRVTIDGNGVLSGSVLHAEKSLSASGSITTEGTISGANLFIGTGITGAGLTTCSNATTSKLLWNAATGRFSCGTDQNTTAWSSTGALQIQFDNRYVRTSGGTMTGTLNVTRTISGAVIHAEKTLSTSGTLVFEGAASGSSLYIASSLQGAGLVDCSTAGTSKLLWNAASGRFSCGTDSNTSVTAGQGLSINGTVITLNATITGSLVRFTSISGSTIFAKNTLATSGSLIVSGTANVRGAFSGSTIHAEKSLTSSGGITAEGAISGASLYIGTSLKGAGLVADCNTSGTSALQWTASTGRFSCGSLSGTFSTGNVLTIGNANYVKIKGDSMTGSLQTPSINLSGVLLTSLNGFNEALNLNTAGLATNGVTRLSALGDLTNIGTIQAGESHFRAGGTFATKADYATGASPWVVAVGDLDGDGKADLATANSTDSTISVFINTGTGTYRAKVDYATGTQPLSLAIGDLNGDGRADLVASNFADTTFSVLMNTGNGTFAPKVDYGTGPNPRGVAIGDLNGDGKADVTVLTLSPAVSVYMNKGNGTFAPKVDYTTGTLPILVSIGDLNGDGKLDIATVNFSGPSVSVLLNKGNGTFATKVDYTTGTGPQSVTMGDVNGDGKADLVVTNSTGNSASVLLNNGNGTFATKVDYTVGGTPYWAAIGDVNGDGKADLAVANNADATVSLLLNKGRGIFAPKVDIATGSGPRSVVMGDFNSDGKMDMAVANNGAATLSVLLNNPKTILYASAGTGGAVGIGTSTPNAKLTVSGSVLINNRGALNNATTDSGVALEVVGTISGSTIYAANTLRSSGSIVAEGAISGANLFIGTGITGAGLTTCSNATTSKLLWNSATGRFSCGSDQNTTAWSSTGSLQIQFDNRYVNTSGDTMTGALAVAITNGNRNTLGINVANTISGAVIHTEKSLTTSGSLVFEGAASGSSLYLGTSLQGAGLVDCSTAGTSKLLWNAASGRFSCGADQNTTYTAGQGLSLNGTVITLNANISGSLIRFTTISGSTVFAKNTLRSSGSLIVDGTATIRGAFSGSNIHVEKGLTASGNITTEGTISGANLFVGTGITGAGLTTCSNAATSKLLWNAATGRFSCGTDQTGGAGFGSGQVIVIGDTRFVRKSGDVMTGSLIIRSTSGSLGIGLNVVGTMSGIGLHISGTGSYPIMRTFPRTGTVIIGSGSIRGGSGYMLPQLYVPGGRTPVLVGNVSTTAAVDHMAVQGNTIVATAGTVLRSFDISTPTNPKFLSTAAVTSSNPASIVMQGKYAFIGVQIRIQSFDVSNPAAIVPLHVFTPTSAVNALAIQGQYLYSLNTTSARFQVIDISNPAQMISRGLVVTGTTPNAVAVQGRYAYITNGGSNTLQTIDLKNPTLPVSLGTVAAGTTPNGVAVQGRFVYVINSAGLQIFDASNPSSVVSVSTLATGAASDIKVSGRYAYIVGTNGFQTVDISDPKAPYLVSTVSTGLTTLNQISLQGRYAYVSYTGGTRLYVYDLGGADIQNAEIGILDAGAVNIRELLQGMDASFQGSVSAGASLIVAGHASFGTGGMVTIGTGGLVVRGPGFSGSSVYAATSIQGAGLTDCSTAGSSKLLWTASTGRFSCGSDQNTNWSGTGALQNQFDNRYVRTSGGTMTGALNVTRSISGAVIHAEKTLSSSGSIVAEGTISGANLYVGTSIRGAGLVTDCNTSGTSALQWTASTGRFSCGSISGGGTFSTGNVLTIGSAKYVSKQGDTMTGSLVINQTTAPTNRSGALVVRNTVSGASGALVSAVDAPVLLLNSNLESRQAPHILFGYKANFDTALWRSSANVLSTNGTFSGTTVYAAKSLRSSGSIVAEGAISGASLYIGTSIRGAGLVTDCNTSTSALQWTASTGRFSCGTISAGSTFSTGNVLTIGSAKYVSRFGDTITGTLKLPAVLFSSGSTLTGGSGFNEFVNLIRGGLATKSITRITADGNLTNIGSIQSGEINATMGGIFAFNKTYPVSSLPRAIDSADYNGDGKPDLALALTNVDQVAVLLNSGTGGFLTAVNYAVGDVPLSIASADYNGDGIPDLAVGNNSDNNVSILINKGNGTFLTAVNYAVGASPNDIEAGDLNNDGLMDLAVVNNQAPSMSILLNRGSGRFAPAVDYTTGSYPTGIAIGDLNGDSKQDIAVSSYNTNKANIFINAGNGTFAAKVDYTVSANSLGAYDVDIGDTNGDKKPDLALVESLGNFVSILRNNGNGTFGTYTTYPTVPGDQPFKVRLADLNGDGKKDVIMNHYLGYNISTYLNTGTGTFPARVDYNVGINPQGFVVQDFNGDGKVDFATALTTDIAAGVYFNTPRTILYASTGTGGFVSIGTAVTKAKLTVTGTISRGTGAYITSSGGTVLALEASTQSGSRTPNIAFGYRGNFDTRITRTATGSLRFASNTGTLLTLDTERSDTTGNVFQIISDASTSYGGPDENRVFRIQANGAVFTDGAVTSIGADYAEWFYSGNERLMPGEVVCIDITKNNSVKRCINAADANIMGIVSTNPAFIGNGISGADGLIPPGYALIGLIGQVPAHVIVEGTGAIRPGDALTSAKKPGYARKALPGESTVGVALEGLTSGEGTVNVLISRRNSSMTVDAVGQKVLDTIASMKIGDEVQLMVASSLENLNVDDQIQTEVRNQVSNLKSYDADIFSLQAEIDDLKNQLAIIKSQTGSTTTVVTTGSGSGSALAADLTAATLVLEQTLTTGGDARIGGDLHIDGTLMASSLFVPNGLTIDGGTTVAGTLAATTITASSGATIDGTLTVNGNIRIHSGALLFDSGSTVQMSNLIVENSLRIVGSITIDGLARFFGNVEVYGELRVSGRQAGVVTVPAGSKSVSVQFSTGFSAVPIITATPNDFVFSAWRVKPVTQTGFTIEFATVQDTDVAFSWHALIGLDQGSTGIIQENTSTVFPMGSDNIPVSSDMFWNACIRNTTLLDADGKPHSCARYHEDFTWHQPDLLIDFLWNTNMTPPLLIVPSGYTIEVTESEDSIRNAFSIGDNEEAPQSSSVASSEESSEQTSSATSSIEQSSSMMSSETSSAEFSESSASSESLVEELTINPVTPEAEAPVVTEPTPEPESESAPVTE